MQYQECWKFLSGQLLQDSYVVRQQVSFANERLENKLSWTALQGIRTSRPEENIAYLMLCQPKRCEEAEGVDVLHHRSLHQCSFLCTIESSQLSRRDVKPGFYSFIECLLAEKLGLARRTNASRQSLLEV